MEMDPRGVNHWSLVENEKAKEFHAANHDKFMSTFRAILAKAAATSSNDKRVELRQKAESLRNDYNAKLRKFCQQ